VSVAFAVLTVGLLTWLAVTVIRDAQLTRRGIVVAATVEDIRGNDKSHDCLTSFTLDGVAYRQLVDAMPDCRVGDRKSVIVDPHDRTSVYATDAHDDRWILYTVVGVVALIAGWLAISIHRTRRRHEQWMADFNRSP
jgi:hypothetical protein